MLVFLLGCSRFSKLLKLHHTERKISNNFQQENKHRVPQAWYFTYG